MSERLLRAELDRVAPGLVAARRALHRRPELAFQEVETAALCARRCREAGLQVTTGVGVTGVLADLGGTGPGPTVLVRADMDALPVDEAPDRAHRSEVPGVMHACGHDGHVAVALGAAEVLSRLRRHWPGRVRVCFQPAEETDEGAARMISEGALDGVDAAVGLHLQAGVETGTVAIGPGVQWASSDEVRLLVRGEGGHAGDPAGTVDPITAGAALVLELRGLSARWAGQRSAVVTVGQFSSGSAPNVVPSEARLTGTVRVLREADRPAVIEALRQVAAGVVERHGTAVDVEFGAHCPAVVCDAHVTGLIAEELAAAFGAARVVAGTPSTTSDDMARFLQRVPGCYFRVGASDLAQGPAVPHHHPEFDLDERALPVACEALVRATLRLLRDAPT